MIADAFGGELKAIHIQKVCHIELLADRYNIQCFQISEVFYCVNGNVSIVVDEKESIILSEGDLLVLNRQNLH
ncbi:hypothetical protein [Niallia sp. 03133]|uniref:hypothetical protein n=1 Tax=Niallia sp. 03133 TaxID=3458060 RepID=UPI004045115B